MRIRLPVIAVVVLMAATSAGAAPSIREILHRVVAVNSEAPDVASADVLFKLRVKKPMSDPPDCEFTGTMRLVGGHQSVRVGQRTSGLLCWAVNQYLLGQLFEASEPLGNFLDRFDFRVLGEKLEGGEHHYLVQGTARDPNNNPRSMAAWIAYERGLFTDGRLEYDWGTVESQQRYARVNGAWMLAHQLLRSSRFDATLEVSYSNYQFAR